MSIALLGKKDFKHRFQDDMESIYYVLFLASILYLPRKEVYDFEKLISDFFDSCHDLGEINVGGSYKIANVSSVTFRQNWQFDNTLVRKCLDTMIKLQQPFQKQPDWTPQALYAILESTDKDDLPLDDRMDHLNTKRTRRYPRMAPPYVCSLKYGHTSSEELVLSLSKTAQPSPVKAETSNKRSMDELELEDCGEPVKRPCGAFSAESLLDQVALED